MARACGFLAFVLTMTLAAASSAEIVKATVAVTTVYDGKTPLRVKIEGKRFMAYNSTKDQQGNEWYLVEMTFNQEKKLVWILARDVAVDWGQAKTVRVVKVHSVNTLELPNNEWLQFAGITVAMGQACTPKTLAWLKQALEGKEVVLEYDPNIPRNSRDYKVAYVYVDGLFVNRALVEWGLAKLDATSPKSRYWSVFTYYVKRAEEARLGVWGEEQPAQTPESKPQPHEQQAPPEPIQNEEDHSYVRHLSDAERAQWARNLLVTVVATKSRAKTRDFVEGQRTDSETGKPKTERVDDIVESRVLQITVKNGWGMALADLRLKYEVFSKTGKTTASVILLKTGELKPFNLAAGETHTFSSEAIEFKGTDSTETGWQGNRYYGYRLTFYLKGTPVRVVATPEWLANYGSSEAGAVEPE